MNVWKIVCATLVIFIAGIVTGVVLVRIGERGFRPGPRVQREAVNRVQTNLATGDRPLPSEKSGRPNNSPPLNSGPLSREFVLSLESQLRLSPAQRDQVNRLMTEGQERIRALREGIDPEIRTEMQKTHEQIQAVLTPEQREQFQRLMKQRLLRRTESPPQPDRRFREPRGAPEFREPRNPLPPGDNARHPEAPKP